MNSLMSTQSTEKNYGKGFAAYYDRLMSGKKYAAWDSLIAEVAASHAIPAGSRCLDLACGTGTISAALARQGFKPVGVDLSEAMLQQARAKVPDGVFTLADMRDFSLTGQSPLPFAVCFYDSLNYLLTDDDMRDAFRCVKRHLADGGVFLFDMNTRDHTMASQANKPRIFEWEDVFVTFRFGGVDRLWDMDLDIFTRQADGDYRHERERHTERGYDRSDIEPLLVDAGFRTLEVRSENKKYEDGQELPSRLYFVAQA